ncbi:MAG: AsmA family protein, partial [Hyphomicrobiaceae bacterium]
MDHRTTGPHRQPSPKGTARRPLGKGGLSYAPPPGQRRQRSLLASIMLYAGSGLILLAALALVFVVLVPPTDLIRQQAIAAVKQQTGRDLAIRGPASLTFYPAIGVSLADVSLSAPPGMSAPATVEMKRLDVAVKLLPLISRQIEVKQLVLTRPRIDLRIDKSGRASWDMVSSAGIGNAPPLRFAEVRDETRLDDSGGTARGIVVAQASSRPPGVATGGRPSLEGLALEDVRIVDGSVDYTDERSGVSHAISSLDAAITADKLTSPLTAKGDLDWRGQTIGFDATANSLATLMRDGRARLAVSLRSKPLALDYSGSADTGAASRAGAALDGNLTVNAPSVRAMLKWVGHDVPPGDGLGPLSLKSRLRASPGKLTLDGSELALDAIRATGTVQATTDGARPHVRADLSVAALNLNPYIAAGAGPAATPTPEPARHAPGTAAPRTAPPAATPRSIEDLLDAQRGPQVRGYTARAGWSDEPIDLAWLRLVDADAKLNVGRLIVR